MKKLFTMAIFALIMASCSEDDPAVTTGDLTLSLSNLSESASGEVYEGWIIVEGSPVSTGTFTVDGSGVLSQNTFEIDNAMLESATAFVLSIEPMTDTDPAPSNIKILGGDFSGSSASVSVSHPAALNASFSTSTGTFILATPTTSTTDDELSGIWFLDLSSGSPEIGLDLPALPSNWKYEGWSVINGQPVSSGTFSAANVVDDADPFSGMGEGPPFPGEDFVNNAPSGLSFPTDLSEATMVISIEPFPDNDAAPFLFKPLVGTAPASAQDHFNYAMENQVASTFPGGMVSR